MEYVPTLCSGGIEVQQTITPRNGLEWSCSSIVRAQDPRSSIDREVSAPSQRAVSLDIHVMVSVHAW